MAFAPRNVKKKIDLPQVFKIVHYGNCGVGIKFIFYFGIAIAVQYARAAALLAYARQLDEKTLKCVEM